MTQARGASAKKARKESWQLWRRKMIPATASCRRQSHASSLHPSHAVEQGLSTSPLVPPGWTFPHFCKSRCETQLVSETRFQVILNANKRQLEILGKPSPWLYDKNAEGLSTDSLHLDEVSLGSLFWPLEKVFCLFVSLFLFCFSQFGINELMLEDRLSLLDRTPVESSCGSHHLELQHLLLSPALKDFSFLWHWDSSWPTARVNPPLAEDWVAQVLK